MSKEVAQWFLENIFSGIDDYGGHLVIWSSKTRYSAHPDSIERAVDEALKLKIDAYFGVCPIRGDIKLPSMCRGKVEQSGGMHCVWADFDIAGPAHTSKKPYPKDASEVKQICQEIGLRPSILVSSGHGFHAYWLFHEPETIENDEGLKKCMELSSQWGETVLASAAKIGRVVDSVWDLARVLRVPGTKNSKRGEDRDVFLVDPITWEPIDGVPKVAPARYDVSDIEEVLVEDASLAVANRQCSVVKHDPAEIDGKLTINLERSPDLAKFTEWREKDVFFRKAFDMKLPAGRLNDQSPSGYEMCLANLAIKRGWDDQLSADLLIYFRVTHGEKPEKCLRKGYIANLIAKARAAYSKDEVVTTVMELDSRDVGPMLPQESVKTMGEMTTEQREKAEDAAEKRRNEILKAVRPLFGVPVVRWIQEGTDVGRERYAMILADGTYIAIGSAVEAMSQQSFRRAIYVSTRRLMDKIKDDAWQAVLRQLGQICEVMEAKEASEAGELETWLESYLEIGIAEGSEDITEARQNNMPYLKDNEIHINLGMFMKYIDVNLRERTGTKSDLCRRLRKLGWSSSVVAVKMPDGKRTSRNYWKGPWPIAAAE